MSEVYRGWDYAEPFGTDDIFIPGTTTRMIAQRQHDTCPLCRAGYHGNHMTERRCLRPVDPVPYDFVCLCGEIG